ncbi:MAG TPA: flagellar hook-length control protein FliK [Burkholderiales bacterium]|nr:flagellar hook-length control protein FliK [Burkholderiales bacterium]
MITTILTSPAAPAKGGSAAHADDAAGSATDASFAQLLGAGIGKKASLPVSTNAAKPGKPGDDAANDPEIAACDPTTLLGTIAAGQAGLDTAAAAAAGAHAAAHATSQIVPGTVPAKPTKDSKDDAATAVVRQMPATAKPVATAVRDTRDSATTPTDVRDAAASRHASDKKPDATALPADDARPVQAPQAAAPLAAPIAPELPQRQQDNTTAALPAASSPAPVQMAGNTSPGVYATAMAHLEQISQPMGSPQWDDGFSGRIVWMAKNDVQSASIKLNPPELGPVEVKLTLTSDAGSVASAAVHFSAAHAATRDAIEQALPRLQEMLRENGISLGNTTVDAGNPGNTGGFADSGNRASGNAARGDQADRSPPDILPSRSTPLPRNGSGLVDTFA